MFENLSKRKSPMSNDSLPFLSAIPISILRLSFFNLQVGCSKKCEAKRAKKARTWTPGVQCWSFLRGWRVSNVHGKFMRSALMMLIHSCHSPLQDPLMRRMEGSQMMPPGAVIHHRIPMRRPNKLMLWIKNFQFQAKKIDVFSRVFFPFVFAIFNIWYWSYYLTRAQNGKK